MRRHLEAAKRIMQTFDITGSNAAEIERAIHAAIVEATNAELERRRSLERIVAGLQLQLEGRISSTGDGYLRGVLDGLAQARGR